MPSLISGESVVCAERSEQSNKQQVYENLRYFSSPQLFGEGKNSIKSYEMLLVELVLI